MPRSYRIGVLGLSHDHIWDNLPELKAHPQVELVAAADPSPPLLARFKQETGCPVYDSAFTLLDKERLDAVYIYSDNRDSVGLAELALGRKLHVVIEKPMAADLEGADQLLVAARQAGVRLMVAWFFAWWPGLQKALAMAQAGELGVIWQVKYRAAHNGPKEMGCSTHFYEWLYDRERNGAGALMDYCCYGAVLARLLLGMPSRVSAVAGRLVKEDIDVDDNAVLLMTYPRALAIAEASWTQIGKLSTYVTMIHGTKGTLLVEPRKEGRLLHATEENPQGVEVKVPTPPPELSGLCAHFIHGLETGAAFTGLCDARICRDAQEILEAGLLSTVQGAEVSLPLPMGTY